MTLIRNICNWFEQRDKLAHFCICFLATFVNIWFAIGMGVTIEIMQVKQFGIAGRIRDTVLDLVADGFGIMMNMGVFWLLVLN